jgi:tetratricopeptide (TPR) repeat protein
MAEWSPKVRKVSAGDDRKSLAFVASLITERRFKEAEQALVPVLDRESRSFGAHMAMGRALQGQKRYEESQHYLSRAVELDPMEATAHYLSGLAAYFTGDYPFAAKRFKTSIDIERKSSLGHLGLARVLYRLDDLEGAQAYADEGLRLDPQSVAARLLRARIFSRQGNSEKALAEINSVLTLDANSQIALVSIAVIEIQHGNHEPAVAALTRATKHHDESALTWALLGREKLILKDYPGAETAIRNSIGATKQGRAVGRVIQLIEALLPQGKIDEAKSLLNRLPRHGALAAAVQKTYGDVYYAQEKYDLAAAAYRTACTQAENFEEERTALEASLVAEGAETNPKRVASVMGAAITRRLEAGRLKFLSQEWHALLDKYEPMMADLAEARHARSQGSSSLHRLIGGQ